MIVRITRSTYSLALAMAVVESSVSTFQATLRTLMRSSLMSSGVLPATRGRRLPRMPLSAASPCGPAASLTRQGSRN